MSTLRSRILSARDVEAAGETEEDMFCYIATPGGQSVQGGRGETCAGLVLLRRVPRVAKSVPTYISTVAKTKKVVLILPNWLCSGVLVL